MIKRGFVCALLCSGTLLSQAFAHDPGLSSAAVTVSEGAIDALVTFNLRDLEVLPEFSLSAGSKIAPDLLRIQAGESTLPLQSVARVEAASNNTTFHLHWVHVGEGRLHISSGVIEQLPFGHRQLVSVSTASGVSLGQRLISAQENDFVIALASVKSAPSRSGFADFFLLGVRHILTGYDHLLFLVGILLACRSFGAAARIITCFTIAHSITLALATFNVVAISSRVVEPMIAASIVYVGVENLWRRNSLRWREAVTFGFGLIHGLGFASVLREMGIGATALGLAVPLFSFNFGVEAGQLAFAACVLPLALKLKNGRDFDRVAIPALSLLVAAAGAYWLIERIVRA